MARAREGGGGGFNKQGREPFFTFILERAVAAGMDLQVTCSGITSSQQSTYDCIKRLERYKKK